MVFEIIEYTLSLTLVITVFVHAGFALHELTHYRVVSLWTDELEIKFFYSIPKKVRFDPSKLTNSGLRWSAVAPTLVFLPVLVISIITVGPPPIWNVNGVEIFHVGYYFMIVISSITSPIDLFIFLWPEEGRKISQDEENLTQMGALLRLIGVESTDYKSSK